MISFVKQNGDFVMLTTICSGVRYLDEMTTIVMERDGWDPVHRSLKTFTLAGAGAFTLNVCSFLSSRRITALTFMQAEIYFRIYAIAVGAINCRSEFVQDKMKFHALSVLRLFTYLAFPQLNGIILIVELSELAARVISLYNHSRRL